MELFKKNRRFNYKPRYQKTEDEKPEDDFKSKWQYERQTSKRKKSVLTSLPIMVLFLILILILLYVLSRYE